MKTVLVLGGDSQLAACIRKLSKDSYGLAFVFLSSKEADITDYNQLTESFSRYRPEVVINCAAYTAVDQAEEEVEKAELINAKAPGDIARCCKVHGALLIHISTDFVFTGDRCIPLKETDQTIPLGVYGKTKLAGEKSVIESWEKSIVIRTSWLYSEYGHNFLKTMLRLGKEKDKLGVVADQIGTPTYAMDLASLILRIAKLSQPTYGIFHFSNEGVASWFDFAHAIFNLSGIKLQLLPLSTPEFPTKARRPAFSVLDKSHVKKTFHIVIPHWYDSLCICLKAIDPLR